MTWKEIASKRNVGIAGGAGVIVLLGSALAPGCMMNRDGAPVVSEAAGAAGAGGAGGTSAPGGAAGFGGPSGGAAGSAGSAGAAGSGGAAGSAGSAGAAGSSGAAGSAGAGGAGAPVYAGNYTKATRQEDPGAVFSNPHQGPESWAKANATTIADSNYRSTVIRSALYWDALQPTMPNLGSGDGSTCGVDNNGFKSDLLDDLLAAGRSTGRTVGFRLQYLENEAGDLYSRSPLWLQTGTDCDLMSQGSEDWYPDWNDTDCRKYLNCLFHQLGSYLKKDGREKLVDFVQLGMMGTWADSDVSRKAIIDGFNNGMPDHPYRMIGIGAPKEARTYAIDKGHFGLFTNSFASDMAQELFDDQNAKIGDLWKLAPIETSPLQPISSWGMKQGVDKALAQHLNYMLWGSSDFSSLENSKDKELKRLLKRMGYRLVLVDASFPQSPARGDKTIWTSNWKNVGNNPLYFDYYVSYRLATDDGQKERVLPTSDTLRGLLTNENQPIKRPIVIPADVSPDSYHVYVGLKAYGAGNPRIRLAVKPAPDSRDQDLWYYLGDMTVK